MYSCSFVRPVSDMLLPVKTNQLSKHGGRIIIIHHSYLRNLGPKAVSTKAVFFYGE